MTDPMTILAWILLVIGLLGMATVIGIARSLTLHKRRLEQMRKEADRKRECYFVLSDKIDDHPKAPARRARFLP